MLKYVWMLLFLAAPAAAEVKTAEPPPVWLKSVFCRIVSREGGATTTTLRALNENTVDTLSKNLVDRSLSAVIAGGRRLDAGVQHVYVDLPRERFNVAMTLDGKTHLRMNHLDLDIYLETTIDGNIYTLHCFRETSEVGFGPQGAFNDSSRSQNP